jgi:hypothetical protein
MRDPQTTNVSRDQSACFHSGKRERKVHDVIMDGIDTVLEQHGHPPTERRKRGAKAS